MYRITDTFCTPQLKIELEIGGKLREVEGGGEREREGEGKVKTMKEN